MVAIALAILTIGVMRIGSQTFMDLMGAVGAPTGEAAAMFQTSVTEILLVAAVVAAFAALVVGMFLARRIARPISAGGGGQRTGPG